jgi:hypothetical protein
VKEEADKNHVMIWAVKDDEPGAVEQLETRKLERVIHIGPYTTDEEVTQHITQEIAESVRRALPCARKPPTAFLTLYIPKHYFQMLGRPTIDDMIQIDARVIRQRY